VNDRDMQHSDTQVMALSEQEATQLGRILAEQLDAGPSVKQLSVQRLRLAKAFAPQRHADNGWRVVQVWHGVGKWLGARTTAVALGGIAAVATVGLGVGIGKYRSLVDWRETRGVELSAEPLRAAGHAAGDGAGPEEKSGVDKVNVTQGVWRSRGRGTASTIVVDGWLQAEAEPLELEWLAPHNVASTDARGEGRIANLVRLEPGARARVLSVGDDGLVLSLEHGDVVVEGESSAVSPCEVFAGPYSVRSAEASYNLSWTTETRTLALRVHKGSALVVDNVLAEQRLDKDGRSGEPAETRRVVAAGQRLVLGDSVPEHKASRRDALKRGRRSVAERSVAERSVAERSAAVETFEVGRSGKVAPRADVNTPKSLSTQAVISGPGSNTGGWKVLAESGQYREAVSAASEVGFATVQASASASDLLLLADAARLGGAPNQAKAALQLLRKNFPTHPNAAIAAFTLGRMAQELDHNDKAALKWYRTYLSQEPQGRMAEGARARVLKGALRVGSTQEVQAAARDYLAHHPSGSSAALARQSL
jgi:transmembrane sensor